jgi:hypothetical protein
MTQHTVLYTLTTDPEIRSWWADADTPDDAINQFKVCFPGANVQVLFCGTGTANECMIRYQMYEADRPANVRVYKVVAWLTGYRHTMIVLVGADTEEFAWVTVREYLRELNYLGLIKYGDKSVTRMPMWAREYGILDVEDVEN